MPIRFEEILNGCISESFCKDNGIKVEDVEEVIRDIKIYVLKQISRCKYEILNDLCYVHAIYNNSKIEVIVSNNININDFLIQIDEIYKGVLREASIDFIRSKIMDYNGDIIYKLREYKTKNLVKGKDLNNNILYKMYSREPLEEECRKKFGATWIDYEKQLQETKDIIFDEGIAGLWSFPKDVAYDCIRRKICRERYGERIFVVEPIDDCFYFDDGKEVIGDRFKVIDSMSLKDEKDIMKLLNTYFKINIHM